MVLLNWPSTAERRAQNIHVGNKYYICNMQYIIYIFFLVSGLKKIMGFFTHAYSEAKK